MAETAREQIERVAKGCKIKLTFVKPDDAYCMTDGEDFYKNKCILKVDVKTNGIIVGLFEDENRMLASFFHQVGHTIIDRSTIETSDVEKEAIKRGDFLAEVHGITLDKAALAWVRSQAKK